MSKSSKSKSKARAKAKPATKAKTPARAAGSGKAAAPAKGKASGKPAVTGKPKTKAKAKSKPVAKAAKGAAGAKSTKAVKSAKATKGKQGKKAVADSIIVVNKKARHDFRLEDDFEAGLALQGWEVKSLRQKKVQLVDSYVLVKDGEAFLLGCNVTPLNSASSHVVADPTRTKKLLLHRKELARLFAATRQKGQTCVCTRLYWKHHLVKARLALAKGKQAHDKRATTKEREWNIDKQRIVRHANR